MVSLKAFRRNYELFEYSLPEIQEHYLEWVKETMYMILSQWNKKKQRNDIFAVKCAKRGNDVYRSRVGRRFRGVVSRAENAVFFNPKDRGAKKTLGLCWAFRKRAFSVSGKFRQLLSDLIRYLHNSNPKTQQITLTGEIIQDEKYVVQGFVPADVVRLKREIWFKKLDMQQITSVDEYLTHI